MAQNDKSSASRLEPLLLAVEKVGNLLPDPAILFFAAMLIVWGCSWYLAPMTFSEIDPRSGQAIAIQDLTTSGALATFFATMVTVFTSFAPLGIVLVAMLGIGVAEQAGFIHATLRVLLSRTPQVLLTPMVVLAGLLSHTAVDAGYVLVIPLGGVIFHASGRHPLAGIAAAFAGVAGGFSANLIPSALDPLLQGFTQSAAQLIDPDKLVNPLCNYYFTASSCFLIVGVAWYLTDKVIEPHVAHLDIEENGETSLKLEGLSGRERAGFVSAVLAIVAMLGLLVWAAWPVTSPLRTPDGDLTSFSSPLMRSIVPLIFILAAVPGMIYGFLSGNFKSGGDVIKAMSKSMEGMGHYIVMAFFCALFIDAFGRSNVGALLAIKGAAWLKAMALPAQVTIIGMILLTCVLNLLLGSASAKWALIGPIMVPMLMQVGLSPELSQAAYRVGDSASNVITPLNPYFPLVVAFCQRWVKSTGIGTVVSLMLPYTVVFLIVWTLFLLGYWALGIPLGLQASYTY